MKRIRDSHDKGEIGHGGRQGEVVQQHEGLWVC